MEVVGMIGLVIFLICITRLMILDLIAYKEHKKTIKVAYEIFKKEYNIDKILMKMEKDLKKKMEEKSND